MNPVRKSDSKAPAKGAAPKMAAPAKAAVKPVVKAAPAKAPAAKAVPAKKVVVEAPKKAVPAKAVAKPVVKAAPAKAPAAKAAPAKTAVVEAPKKAAPAKAAAKPAAKAAPVKKTAAKGKLREVYFEKYAPASASVAVAGEFSGWEAVGLSKGDDGVWRGVVLIAPGSYAFKLVFDGQHWEYDPERETVEGPHGLNNLLIVT